jgi:hypothetical protein
LLSSLPRTHIWRLEKRRERGREKDDAFKNNQGELGGT